MRTALLGCLLFVACARTQAPRPAPPLHRPLAFPVGPQRACDPGDPCPDLACGARPGMCGGPPTHCGPCADCPELDPSSPTGTLVARLVDARTGAVVPGAELRLAGTPYVDPRASPEVHRLPPGEVRVRVTARGYEPLEATVTIDRCRLRRDFELQPVVPDAVGPASCDPRRVRCRAPAPRCPEGKVPQVVDGCYGACVEPEECGCLEAAACPEATACGRNGRCAPRALSCDRRNLGCRQPEDPCPAGLVRSFEGSCFGPCIFPSACVCADGQRCPPGLRCSGSGLCAGR